MAKKAKEFGINVLYVDLIKENLREEDVLVALDKYDIIILDEASRLRVDSLPSFIYKLSEVIPRNKKVIITTSYSPDHWAILEELKRAYGKYLKPPKSKRGNRQPYRIYALPRNFWEVYVYLTRKKIRGFSRRIPFAFIKHAVPSKVLEISNYKSVTEESYYKFASPLIDELSRKVLDFYLIAGGFPQNIRVLQEELGLDVNLESYLDILEVIKEPLEYVVSELSKVLAGKNLEGYVNAILGFGDRLAKLDEGRKEVIKTYLVYGLPKSLIPRERPSIREVREIYPIAIDPGAFSAIYYYYSYRISRPKLSGALEAFVLNTLIYLSGYTYPRIRTHDLPP